TTRCRTYGRATGSAIRNRCTRWRSPYSSAVTRSMPGPYPRRSSGTLFPLGGGALSAEYDSTARPYGRKMKHALSPADIMTLSSRRVAGPARVGLVVTAVLLSSGTRHLLATKTANRPAPSDSTAPVGVQLYSFRHAFKTDVPGTLAHIRALGFKEV